MYLGIGWDMGWLFTASGIIKVIHEIKAKILQNFSMAYQLSPVQAGNKNACD